MTDSPDATSAVYLAKSAAMAADAQRLPWHRPELKRWAIVGMNHYRAAERWHGIADRLIELQLCS